MRDPVDTDSKLAEMRHPANQMNVVLIQVDIMAVSCDFHCTFQQGNWLISSVSIINIVVYHHHY